MKASFIVLIASVLLLVGSLFGIQESFAEESTQEIEIHVCEPINGNSQCRTENITATITSKTKEELYQFYRDTIISYPSENPASGVYSLSCPTNLIEINYKITNGKLLKINENHHTFSLFLDVEADDQGIITLDIPKNLVQIGKLQNSVEFGVYVIPETMKRIILHVPPIEISDNFQISIPFEKGTNELILTKYGGFLCNSLNKMESTLQEFFDAGFEDYGIVIYVKKPSPYEIQENIKINPSALKLNIEKLHQQWNDEIVTLLEKNNAIIERASDHGFIYTNVHRSLIPELLLHDHIRKLTCAHNNCGVPIDFDAIIIPEDSRILTKLGGIVAGLTPCKSMGGIVVNEIQESKPSGIYKFCKWNERYFGISNPGLCTASIVKKIYIPTGEIVTFGGCVLYDVNKELWKRYDEGIDDNLIIESDTEKYLFENSLEIKESNTRLDDLSPKKQQKYVNTFSISCKIGLELVFKPSNDSPACVKYSTAEKLIERGWTSR